MPPGTKTRQATQLRPPRRPPQAATRPLLRSCSTLAISAGLLSTARPTSCCLALMPRALRTRQGQQQKLRVSKTAGLLAVLRLMAQQTSTCLASIQQETKTQQATQQRQLLHRLPIRSQLRGTSEVCHLMALQISLCLELIRVAIKTQREPLPLLMS